MFFLGTGLDFRFLYQPPGVQTGVPDFATPARIAGDAVPVSKHKSLADEVEGVEVLGENDDAMALSKNLVKAFAECFKFAVHRDLAQLAYIVIKVQPLILQLVSPLRVAV